MPCSSLRACFRTAASPTPRMGWRSAASSATRWRLSARVGWRRSEFIDRGDYLVVPYRFGGRARHTGLTFEFSFVHLITLRDGKVTRREVHRTVAEALEAAGLEE